MIFLTLSTGYHHIFIALSDKEKLIAKKEIENKLASKNLILIIDEILKENNLKLSDVKFICVNQGPAPFTSLRTSIATANGIAFATNIPLVGVNGLDALMNEYYGPKFDLNVAILNAFAGDVYFEIAPKHVSGTPEKGTEKSSLRLSGSSNSASYGGQSSHSCDQNYLSNDLKDKHIIRSSEEAKTEKLEKFITRFSKDSKDKIQIFGHISIFKNLLKDFENITLLEVDSASVEKVAQMGYQNWLEQKNITNQIFPLYLK
ncbi:tRNA (adenosine(37)-N6)-threonylcarbamoyltransferase complex dimerization subunit type 1 TsaB [Candidatus Dependentiae bacterium]|nr:tRNA (adenosine(37)-N6)-threonylcarbamoyltransferase complex dimerization subunit type 1 TsaB [Candidatus Dependentiae bacterium]